MPKQTPDPDETPDCFGRYGPEAPVCAECHAQSACRGREKGAPLKPPAPIVAQPIAGELPAPEFHLGHSLGSGQLFRWGRDEDGWWKGVACDTAFHLRQTEDTVQFRASGDRVHTREGEMAVGPFLRWYLRIDEPARVRVCAVWGCGGEGVWGCGGVWMWGCVGA